MEATNKTTYSPSWSLGLHCCWTHLK